MPASSKIWAAYMSYAVSIAHLRPSAFIACRWGMRTLRGDGASAAFAGVAAGASPARLPEP